MREAVPLLFRQRMVIPMIIGEIKRYLRDNNAVRVSRSVRDLAYHALQARELLCKQRGEEPTLDDIHAYLSANGDSHTKKEIATALEAIVEPVSLFDPVYGEGENGEGLSVLDKLCDSEAGEEFWLESIALKEALTSLSPREKSILSMRFYKGRTQMEVADEIGISQAQVSRLEKNALERIKKQM